MKRELMPVAQKEVITSRENTAALKNGWKVENIFTNLSGKENPVRH